MSVIYEQRVKALNNETVMVERFDSPAEVVDVSAGRRITDCYFPNKRSGSYCRSWDGADTFEEAEELMRKGYQPTVDRLKGLEGKINLAGQARRYKPTVNVYGFAPIVPLALMGVPESMMNQEMKPIKTKVLNVYYNTTVSGGTDTSDIISAGEKLLSAVMELEMQGYKFNLYAMQIYYSRGKGADIMVCRVKDSGTPTDLKKMSVPLTHPAFFRMIGFDWYSRTPKGTFRSGLGYEISRDYDREQLSSAMEEIVGDKCVFFNCRYIIDNSIEGIERVLTAK